MLRIYGYATASTDSAAYIIGGYGDGYISTIAQFKNNKWLKIGDLKERKTTLSAIFHDGEYLIVGGHTDRRLVNLFEIIQTQARKCILSIQTLTSTRRSNSWCIKVFKGFYIT